MVAEGNKIRHIVWEDARALEEGRERAFGARPWSPLAPLAGRWRGPPLSVEALEMTNLPRPTTPPLQGVDQFWSDWSQAPVDQRTKTNPTLGVSDLFGRHMTPDGRPRGVGHWLYLGFTPLHTSPKNTRAIYTTIRRCGM